ncbi:MAG: hypothetical protein DRI44_02720 [Chlamydiae bacterium]|nr:MAG: hypothetical protein DRI44_02720 [Chlamydiota bacterium]
MKHFSSLIIFALALSLQSLAAVNILFNPSFGNWNIAGNWHLGRVPTVNDNPIISAGRTAMIDSDVNQCAVVFCGQSASTPKWGKIILRQGGKLTASILILGRDSANHGVFLLCGGELSLHGYLSVGDSDGGGDPATGELFVSAGSLKMLGTAPSYVGYKGRGKMTVSGKGAFYANDVTVGEKSGSEGSEMSIIGGSVVANNITLGTTATSDGKMIVSDGSLVWSNLFYVRDTLTVQNSAPEIRGVKSGGTGFYLDNNSTLEFKLGAKGIAALKMTNSQIHITSGAKLHISGTYYTRASGAAGSFLLIKNNGYAGQTNFTPANVTFSGFGGLIPSLRYKNNCIYLDLSVGSGGSARAAQGIFMKYWQIPIDDDGDASVIPAPLSSMPLFTGTVVRVHPIFGKRVSKIDLSEILREDNILVQFEGYIDIPTAGTYTFYLNSDDGSKMWIDNSLLVNNDGAHGVTEIYGSTTLTKGMHKIEVGYFNNTGGKAFEAKWSGPGISKQEIPEDVLYVSDVKNAFSEMRAFHNIMPDEERTYNYCPSFIYDDVEGLYKIWSGGAGGGDNILYKESPTLEGLLDCPTKSVLQPSHAPSKFDDIHACDPNVFCVSGTFYLSYSGNTDNSDLYEATRIGMAVSYDRGRSWTRLHNGVHILAPAADYTSNPNNYGIGQSAVVRANDGYFYMIYTDVDQFRSGQKTFFRVIRCSDPAFPTNKHEMINSNVQNTAGYSLDLAYDKKSEEFIVITDISDDPDIINDPYTKVRFAYYDKNWNYLRSRIIQVHPLWAFGEGVALLTGLNKEPLNYSYYGKPSLVTAAATCEYNDDAGSLWAEWVGGDTKYLISSFLSHPDFFNPQLLSKGLFFNSNRTDVITTGLRPLIKNNFTVDFWAKPYTDTKLFTEQTNGAIGPIIKSFAVRPIHGGDTHYPANSAGVGFAVGMNGISVYEHGGGYAPPLLTWSGDIFDWTHITVVYSNQTPYLYINGQFTRKGLQSPMDNSYVTIDYFGGDVWGNCGYGGNLWNYRVWTRPLAETEIETLPGTFAEENITSGFYGKWLQDSAIAEGGRQSPLGTKVFDVVVTGGNDDNSRRTYLSDSFENRFVIDPNSGEVSVLKGDLLNYEAASSYTVTVCAADNNLTIANRKFVINISNINMQPHFVVDLNCMHFDGNSSTNIGQTITGIENNFTVSFYAKPEKLIGIPDESTNGIAGLDNKTGFAVVPQHGSAWGNGNVNAGAGISVGTNGIVVYEHGDSYMPAVLAWKSDTPLTDWMQISIIYSNKTPILYVNGIKMKTGLTSTKTVHPSAESFGGISGIGFYKGEFTEYRVQSVSSTQSSIRDNMETWDINSIVNYKNTFFPELIVTNGNVNGSAVGSLTPYVDLPTDPAIFTLTDDADGRFDIGSSDGIITIEDIAKFSSTFASNCTITVLLTSGSKAYRQDITVHIAENVVPEGVGIWFVGLLVTHCILKIYRSA